MTTTLQKTNHYPSASHKGEQKYWFSLPDKVHETIGKEVIIKRHPITKAFVLSIPNIDSTVHPVKISASNSLRIPLKMVEDDDLGEYSIDCDFENEEVLIIKK